MKRIFTILAVVLLTAVISAQTPEKMSYQAVIRNSSDQLVTNQEIGLRVSILQNSIDGTLVYQEIYNPNPETNNNGLLTIEIGAGVPLTGTFSEIDWAGGPYFIKTETDPSGGTTYTIAGTSQLLSVPYALHSKSSEILTGEISESQITDLQNYLTSEVDPVFNASAAKEITSGNISEWNAAYSWGNHSEQGYLKGYTETDPLFQASAAAGITTTDINKWNTKVGLISASGFTNNCPTPLNSITTTYQKVADLGTFTKQSAASTITVNFNGLLSVDSMTGNGVLFVLRINNSSVTEGGAVAVVRSEEAGLRGIHANMTGIWKNRPAGNYAVGLYARASTGTGTYARIDPGCWSYAQTVVTEIQ